jgi:hypothetical protein
MPEQRSPDIIQVNLRLPKELHKRLVREAKKADRSLNQEMVQRLEQTFERVAADALLEQAHAMVRDAQRMREDTWKMFLSPIERHGPVATVTKRGRITKEAKK